MSTLFGALFGALFFAGLFLGCAAVIFGGTVLFYKIARRLVRKYDLDESAVDLITFVAPLFLTFVVIGAFIGATTWGVAE